MHLYKFPLPSTPLLTLSCRNAAPASFVGPEITDVTCSGKTHSNLGLHGTFGFATRLAFEGFLSRVQKNSLFAQVQNDNSARFNEQQNWHSKASVRNNVAFCLQQKHCRDLPENVTLNIINVCLLNLRYLFLNT